MWTAWLSRVRLNNTCSSAIVLTNLCEGTCEPCRDSVNNAVYRNMILSGRRVGKALDLGLRGCGLDLVWE